MRRERPSNAWLEFSKYPSDVFRPFLHVARPDDWTGILSRIGVGSAIGVLLIAAVLATLPDTWVAMAGGYSAIVRVVLTGIVLYIGRWLQAVIDSRLPASPYLLGSTLVLRCAGRSVSVSVAEIVCVRVDLRIPPAREVFMIDLRDGRSFDLCPVHWAGGPRLYATLVKRVTRAARDRARAR